MASKEQVPQQQFRNLVYLSDTSGTGCWRRIWQANSVNCVSQQTGVSITHTQFPILDQNYYRGVNTVTVQRWTTPQQEQLITNFLKPICDGNSGWLIYEIDDLMVDYEIPQFNKGRIGFEDPKVQESIKKMLNTVDFVTVTTDYIKRSYHKYYGVPLENIICVPNMLPRYLFDDRYDLDKKMTQFSKHKAKPRIGIVSSLSHYNVEGARLTSDGKVARKNEMPDGTIKWIDQTGKEVKYEDTSIIHDDVDDIIDMIRDTINDFQWVFFGYCPPILEDLAKDKKIEVYGGVPIMQYASMLERLQLQAIVAPINDIEFNRCKSPIKYYEACSIGVPLIAKKCLPYTRVMPDDQMYVDSDDLKKKLTKIKYSSAGAYRSMVEKQYKWLNSPHEEGNFQLKNYWMEDNLEIWINLGRLRQKTFTISMSLFSKQYNERKAKEKENLVYTDSSGIVITK